MPNISKLARFILYADDANIIITGGSIHEIHQKFSQLTLEIERWVDNNGLALNVKKTKYMLFSRQRIDSSSIDVRINNSKIEEKSECRFLGVIVDNKLKWAQHIAAVKMKMSKYLGVMYKIKSKLPLKVRIQIFQSFVQSHINFCPLIWGFAAKSHIESLFIKQKQGIRAVMPGFVNYWYKDDKLPEHTKSSFKEYGILTVHGIIAMNALVFIHKAYHYPQTLPSSIVKTVPINTPRPGYVYDECKEWLHKYNNIPFRATIFHKGPLLYITFCDITETYPNALISLNLYKKYAKKMLIDQQSSGDGDRWPNFPIFSTQGLLCSARNKK